MLLLAKGASCCCCDAAADAEAYWSLALAAASIDFHMEPAHRSGTSKVHITRRRQQRVRQDGSLAADAAAAEIAAPTPFADHILSRMSFGPLVGWCKTVKLPNWCKTTRLD